MTSAPGPDPVNKNNSVDLDWARLKQSDWLCQDLQPIRVHVVWLLSNFCLLKDQATVYLSTYNNAK